MSIYHSPFDQFQRYFTVSKIVENLSEDKDTITVLEVGANGHFKLLEFLPKANITFSDIEDHPAPAHINFIKADATNLPFKDGEFDFVVSTDVLEHVPSELRDSFILECFRVSKVAFILACPVDNGFTPDIEKITNDTFKNLHHGTDFRWLKEHEEQGLPRYIDIDSVLDKNFISYFRFNHGRLDWWKSLMQMHFIKEAEPALAKVCKSMDEYYNRYLYQHDVGEYCYRSFWVIGRTELTDSTCLYSEAGEATENLLKIYERISSSCKDIVFASQLKSEKISYNETLLSEMQQELSECRKIISEQESVISAAKSEMSAFKNSTSWRITKPIRIIRIALIYFRKTFLALSSVVKRNGGLKSSILKTTTIFKSEGLAGIKRRIFFLKNSRRIISTLTPDDNSYLEWIRRYDTLEQTEMEKIKKDISSFTSMPKISVVMPVYNAPLEYLVGAIESVKNQLYPNWELCIADDASTDPAIRPLLKSFSDTDSRIQVVFRNENGHISEASNSALKLATGDFIALLDNDDLLPQHALYYVAKEILKNPDIQLIYSDEDKIDLDGSRCEPYFKSDWNIDLFLSQNMFSHLGIFKRELLEKINGFRKGLEGSQDYDLVLRCLEHVKPTQIAHIPKILYHWRIIPGSTATSGNEKPYAFLSSIKALEDYLSRNDISATVQESKPGMRMLRIKYALPKTIPLVSIIIPTRNAVSLLKQCIDSVFNKTSYKNYEIIIVDNGSDEKESLDYLSLLKENSNISVIRDDGDFNFSRLNNIAVNNAKGEVICLMNNDIEIVSPDWLDEMVSHALRPGVGAVGAKLLYPNDTVQHAGVILGLGGIAGHAHLGLHRDDPGYFGRASLVQNYIAVTAACLVVKKSIYQEVGGLNEVHFSVAFNDVDFCIRVHDAGYRNVWTPFAELYHHESATRGNDMSPDKVERFKREIAAMEKLHGDILVHDPSYSENLSLDAGVSSFSYRFR
ncbi:glycosyltransferase [Aeromonas jandaei]